MTTLSLIEYLILIGKICIAVYISLRDRKKQPLPRYKPFSWFIVLEQSKSQEVDRNKSFAAKSQDDTISELKHARADYEKRSSLEAGQMKSYGMLKKKRISNNLRSRIFESAAALKRKFDQKQVSESSTSSNSKPVVETSKDDIGVQRNGSKEISRDQLREGATNKNSTDHQQPLGQGNEQHELDWNDIDQETKVERRLIQDPQMPTVAPKTTRTSPEESLKAKKGRK